MDYQLNIKKICGLIDSTNLNIDIKKQDLKELCENSIKYGFKTVAINHDSIKYCKQILNDSNVGICTGVSYPLGQHTLEEKLFETEYVIKLGATEIDYVINIARLKSKDYKYLKSEMKKINNICKYNNKVCKVILETYYLTDDEIRIMCDIAKEIEVDFIKTSTGQISEGGATVRHVKLIKQFLEGSKVKVKAAGGIRTIVDVLKMIDAGAERIGTSSAVEIVKQYNDLKKLYD